MKEDEKEVERMLSVLRLLIMLLGFNHRQVEGRLGLHPGTLCRVLSHQIDTKLEMVLAIARALGLSYGELFALAYPGQANWERSETAQRLYKSIEAFCPTKGRPPPQAVRA